MSLLSNKEHLAGALLKPINPSASIIIGVYTVLWGIWVASPFWSAFARASYYSVMAQLAPEWVWGLAALFCGGLMIYGATRRTYRELTNGAGSIAILWFLIGICNFLADWQATGGVTSIMIFVYGAFVYLNIRVNYRGNKYLPPDFLP